LTQQWYGYAPEEKRFKDIIPDWISVNKFIGVEAGNAKILSGVSGFEASLPADLLAGTGAGTGPVSVKVSAMVSPSAGLVFKSISASASRAPAFASFPSMKASKPPSFASVQSLISPSLPPSKSASASFSKSVSPFSKSASASFSKSISPLSPSSPASPSRYFSPSLSVSLSPYLSPSPSSSISPYAYPSPSPSPSLSPSPSPYNPPPPFVPLGWNFGGGSGSWLGIRPSVTRKRAFRYSPSVAARMFNWTARGKPPEISGDIRPIYVGNSKNDFVSSFMKKRGRKRR